MTHPQPVEAEAVEFQMARDCLVDLLEHDAGQASCTAWVKAHGQHVLDALASRDARIREMEGEVERHARDMMVYRDAHDQKAALLEEAVKGFKAIRKIKAEPLAGGEFQTGPLSHFLAAQRIASQTLSTIRACKEGEG